MTLDEKYLRQRFEERIAGDVFAHARPSERPVTVLLGAQPGAGKTAGGNRVVDLYPPGEVIRIMGDDLRQYHPDYPDLMATDPLQMPDATDAAMRRWIDMCVDYADEHNYSVLIERTWRSVDATLGSARQAADQGRATHAVVVAVPPELSRLSTLGRYYRDVDSGKPARWTPPQVHDTAAAQLPHTVQQVAASPDVDRFTVTDRSGAILFDSSEPGPDRGRDGFAAFEAAFKRTLTADERVHVLQDVPYLAKAHATHTMQEPTAREVIAWAEGFAQQVEADGRAETAKGAAQAGFPVSAPQEIRTLQQRTPTTPTNDRPEQLRAASPDLPSRSELDGR
ncbi:MAG TPA: zeta toxin family protein [Kineosporiaceae bacterium]|nr:zeta toxin family protein [Kineosporiaceae bacterium]